MALGCDDAHGSVLQQIGDEHTLDYHPPLRETLLEMVAQEGVEHGTVAGDAVRRPVIAENLAVLSDQRAQPWDHDEHVVEGHALDELLLTRRLGRAKAFVDGLDNLGLTLRELFP